MAQLPTGTVTFLFTDLEGSTRRWEEQPEVMRTALALHDGLLRDAIEAHDGHLVKSTGDGAFAVFEKAHDGVGAAVAAQLALGAADWPDGVGLRVRMGLHVGPATVTEGDYFGPDVTRTARLMSVAHGGQIVCSRPVGDLVGDRFSLVDLGEHRLRDLRSSVHVFQVDAPGLATEFPPLRSLDARRGNLPRQMTTFVGRESAIDALSDLVRRSELVTLTGVGGVGKTRLALQVAAKLTADFPEGAWLCEFAPVTDPGAVWDTLAASLGIQALPGRSLEESLLDYLAAKRLLLVLDNCEHLLEAIARQITSIAHRCAQVAVLATSREGLALGGERLVAVPSLGVPADDTNIQALIGADAVQLFAERAKAANNDFVLNDLNARAVAVLCRRLDGIPLAIELAAARVRSLSPEDLVTRLDQRFKLLTKGSRAALDRHQTLRSTIDWSYDLLEPPERQALDRLSVFAGTCDLEAAEAVLAGDLLDAVDVVDVLGQLVDKSLVVADVSNTSGGARYRLLESIRQYAAERLEAAGRTAAVRRCHAEHYVERAETAGPHLRNRGQLEWAQAALRDTDNFRAVLDWATETPSPEHALRLIAPFAMTGLAIGDTARDWAEAATTMPNADEHPQFATVASFASLAAVFAGDLDRAESRAIAAERAETQLGVGPSPAVLRARAVLALFSGKLEVARDHAEAWVESGRESGDPCELADALIMLTGTLLDQPDAAIAALDEAIQVARDARILSALSVGLPFLAGLLPVDESERALALLDEAIEVSSLIGNRLGVLLVTSTKGALAAQRGEWRTALEAAVDSAEQQMEFGDLTNPALLALGAIALCALGRLEASAVLLGKSDSMSARLAIGWAGELFATTDAALLEAFGEQRVATLAARGAALDNAQAIAYLLERAAPFLAAG